jgi:ER-bound oxygenase mpaB/B'/Rubber oxygenase, catalytic domain
MHLTMHRRSSKAGQGIISQKDMALTQFTFMGFPMLNPKMFGIVGSREQFEAFNHLWRVLGYLIGIKDEFNVCGETVGETQSRLEAMREDMFVPALQFPCPEYDSYTKTAARGLWHSDPTLHYNSMMWMMRRALKVPGYYYFDSEASGEKQVYESLSLYTKFRILLDIIIYENLSHIFIFRWIFNISRLLYAISDKIYPVLAVLSYGKKIAVVEIMKAKT